MSFVNFSTNGTVWTSATFTTTVDPKNIEYANYRWGMLETNGQIWTNDLTLNELGNFSISSSYPSGINQLSTFNNNFIGVSNNAVYQSGNLTTWTTLLSSGANKHIKKDNKSLLLQNSGVIQNWNGSSWTSISTGISDNFVDGEISKKANIDTMNTWTTVDPLLGTQGVRTFYKNNMWFAFGQADAIAGTRISTDAITWTTAMVTTTWRLKDIEYANGVYVAPTTRGVLFSTSGIQFSSLSTPAGTTELNSVAYGNGMWCIVGNNGFFMRSTNLTTWTTASILGTLGLVTIVYKNNRFVVGANGAITTSTDGITWTTSTANAGGIGGRQIFSIEYADQTWIAVGGGTLGEIVRKSTDAITWTTENIGMGVTINDIKYYNNLFLVVGASGQARASTNGTTWTTVNATFGSSSIQNIAYGNGTWAISGATNSMRIASQINDYQYLVVGNNAPYYSTDLVAWTTVVGISSSNINDITSQ
jgi:hypothetical protein